MRATYEQVPVVAGYHVRYAEEELPMYVPKLTIEGLPYSRGKAIALVAAETGEPFIRLRANVCYMAPKVDSDEHEGWCADMWWECAQSVLGALPYWRVDVGP